MFYLGRVGSLSVKYPKNLSDNLTLLLIEYGTCMWLGFVAGLFLILHYVLGYLCQIQEHHGRSSQILLEISSGVLDMPKGQIISTT